MIPYSKAESYLKYVSHYCDAVAFTKKYNYKIHKDSSNNKHSLETAHVSGGLANKVVLVGLIIETIKYDLIN